VANEQFYYSKQPSECIDLNSVSTIHFENVLNVFDVYVLFV